MRTSLLLQVKPVEVHHLGPDGDEGVDELLFGVGGGVDLIEGAQSRYVSCLMPIRW